MTSEPSHSVCQVWLSAQFSNANSPTPGATSGKPANSRTNTTHKHTSGQTNTHTRTPLTATDHLRPEESEGNSRRRELWASEVIRLEELRALVLLRGALASRTGEEEGWGARGGGEGRTAGTVLREGEAELAFN